MNGKLVLIVGGAKGIGRAVALRLAGFSDIQIGIMDVDDESARETLSMLGSAHFYRKVDIADESQVVSLFKSINEEFGDIYAVVCAAGLLITENGERVSILDTSEDFWNKTFDVNMKGAFFCSREFLKHKVAKKQSGGRCVFFSSVAAQLGGYRSNAAYIAAKSALLGYSKAFAREAAPLQITSNVVAPGLIDTDMLRSTITDQNKLCHVVETIPLGRIGLVDDVAAAVVYLLSEDASYLTGSVIDVNGGYRMQ